MTTQSGARHLPIHQGAQQIGVVWRSLYPQGRGCHTTGGSCKVPSFPDTGFGSRRPNCDRCIGKLRFRQLPRNGGEKWWLGKARGKKKRETLLNRRGTYDLLPLAGMLYQGPIGEVCEKMCLQRMTSLLIKSHRAKVGQLVEHRAVTREVVSSTPARPTLRVLE